MPRRKFSNEYKLEAVKLVLEGGLSISQAARDLGLGASTLDRWVRAHRDAQGQGQEELSVNEREELRQLRKEVTRLRVEQEILKKAAAYFAKHQL
jgi:transposase